ncbi:MAG TPA: diadenylate cyclase CdaA [Anaerolineae bacterium]|nr:diadenylate cyclase CdaA [Anaerolineae bacterium]
MDLLRDLASGLRVEPSTLLDIFLNAIMIYLVMRLIQGTRAVRLAIGATIVYAVYVIAQELDLRLLSGILQTGAVVGLVALVVVFQPELRRGLDRLGRLGRLGSWAWLGPADSGGYQRTAAIVAAAAAALSRRRTGALIVVERDTGLGDMAEAGVMINADLSAELLASLFAPGYPLHDGAVIVRDDEIVAAAVMLPLADREGSLEKYGTRHRAALGLSEQTDALVIVVSEESGGISLAQGGTIVRNLGEDELRQRLYGLLAPADVGGRAPRPGQPGGEEPGVEEPGGEEPGGEEPAASIASAKPGEER